MSLLRELFLANALLGARAAASPLQPLPGSWHAFEASRDSPALTTQQPSSELIRTNLALQTPKQRGGKVSLKSDKRVDYSGLGSLSDDHRNRIIVIPEYKLFFCGIDHNYFRNFSLFFDGLRRNTKRSGGSAKMLTSALGTPKITKEEIERIFRDKTWHKAVFVRDPVERFLSAALERCARNKTGCSDPNNSSQRLSFTRMMVSALQEFAAARKRGDGGFDWQANYCSGLGNLIGYYDTVEMAEPLTLRDRVAELLAKLGVKGLPGAVFDRYFPDQKHKCVHCRPYLGMLLETVSPKLSELLPFFPESRAWVPLVGNRGRIQEVANARITAILLKIFKPDYAQLGMREPKWALRIIGNGDIIRFQRRSVRSQNRRDAEVAPKLANKLANKGAPKPTRAVEHPHVADYEPMEEEDADVEEVSDEVTDNDYDLEEIDGTLIGHETPPQEPTDFEEAAVHAVAATASKLSSKRRFERNQTVPALDYLAGLASIAASQPAAKSPPKPSRAASFYEVPKGPAPAAEMTSRNVDPPGNHESAGFAEDSIGPLRETFTSADVLQDLASVAPMASDLLKGRGAHIMSEIHKLSPP